MKKSISILSLLLLFISCSKDDDIIKQEVKKATQENKVLILKVNFNNNTFEGGKEFTFANNTTTFTANPIITSNEADGGNIAVYYQELNEKLFQATQSWTGQITFPAVWQPSSEFESALTTDYFLPPTFQNIYNPSNETYNYESVWTAIQGRIKVRSYIISNQNQIAKIFLFTEYGGIVGPRKKWIIMLKN